MQESELVWTVQGSCIHVQKDRRERIGNAFTAQQKGHWDHGTSYKTENSQMFKVVTSTALDKMSGDDQQVCNYIDPLQSD